MIKACLSKINHFPVEYIIVYFFIFLSLLSLLFRHRHHHRLLELIWRAFCRRSIRDYDMKEDLSTLYDYQDF